VCGGREWEGGRGGREWEGPKREMAGTSLMDVISHSIPTATTPARKTIASSTRPPIPNINAAITCSNKQSPYTVSCHPHTPPNYTRPNSPPTQNTGTHSHHHIFIIITSSSSSSPSPSPFFFIFIFISARCCFFQTPRKK